MNTLTKAGRAIFAIGLLALGILCILNKDFIVGRPHAWPAGFNFNPALAYISGLLLIASSIGILFKIKGAGSAIMIAGLIFILSVLRHLPYFMSDWLNAYKAIALMGGSLVVAGSFLYRDNHATAGTKATTGLAKILVVTGTVMLAAFFIAGGYAHFKFAAFVTDFIPTYIPFRKFWAYFCGLCLIAGGVGIMVPKTRTLAAVMSGIMLSGWFLLLHIPRFLTDTKNASDQLGLCESFSFAGICFLLAGVFKSYFNSGKEANQL